MLLILYNIPSQEWQPIKAVPFFTHSLAHECRQPLVRLEDITDAFKITTVNSRSA